METHITTRKAATPIDALRIQMEGEFEKTIAAYYKGNTRESLAFRTAAIDYVRRVPKLLEVTRISLLSALVQAAQFQFMPSGVMGESYIIPYKTEAKFQIGYQGIITLLYRTNKVKGITAQIVYANDEFNYEEGLNPILYHKPAPFGKKRGEAIGVYTVAQLEGGAKTFKVMDKDAVMGIKELSKAKNSAESPWNSDKDPELWMWKKTCLIQHAKTLPKTPELQRAIELDYEGEGLEKGDFKPDGVATGKAPHGTTPPAAHSGKGNEQNPEKPKVTDAEFDDSQIQYPEDEEEIN